MPPLGERRVREKPQKTASHELAPSSLRLSFWQSELRVCQRGKTG